LVTSLLCGLEGERKIYNNLIIRLFGYVAQGLKPGSVSGKRLPMLYVFPPDHLRTQRRDGRSILMIVDAYKSQTLRHDPTFSLD
jgi:hypothetical protein